MGLDEEEDKPERMETEKPRREKKIKKRRAKILKKGEKKRRIKWHYPSLYLSLKLGSLWETSLLNRISSIIISNIDDETTFSTFDWS